MARQAAAVILIYLGVSLGWVALGTSMLVRTGVTDSHLEGEVAKLWGAAQQQVSPELVFAWEETAKVTEQDPATSEPRLVTRERLVRKEAPVILDRSAIEVGLRLDQRRKGLLWYPTYAVDFDGDFSYTHDDDRAGSLVVTYRFPTADASYDDFRFEVAGKLDPKVVPEAAGAERIVRHSIPVARGTTVPFAIGYRSRGLGSWQYSFGTGVNRVKDFSLAVTTDFRDVDFPSGTISPTSKTETAEGWHLDWRFTNLISGFRLGVEMPRELNPGPLAARISYFAPVSLGFFFAWVFAIGVLRGVRLHPMNYLFLAAAFFAFHLLFAYTVDRIDLRLAFALASAVSVFLVVSYLRLVTGLRFAALEAGLSQVVYLVLFSLAHFLEGFTGLVVTVGSILTLFALMQLTGRIDWHARLALPGVRGASGNASAG